MPRKDKPESGGEKTGVRGGGADDPAARRATATQDRDRDPTARRRALLARSQTEGSISSVWRLSRRHFRRTDLWYGTSWRPSPRTLPYTVGYRAASGAERTVSVPTTVVRRDDRCAA